MKIVLAIGAHFDEVNKMITTFSTDGIMRQWRINDSFKIARIMLHNEAIVNAQFSKDGSLILTNCMDDEVRFWQTETGSLAVAPIRYKGRIENIMFKCFG